MHVFEYQSHHWLCRKILLFCFPCKALSSSDIFYAHLLLFTPLSVSYFLYLFRPFSLSPALSSLHQAVHGSSLQFTSLPAQITELGQAVHYFKFTACPFGLPQGGIKSGFGWRSDLVPSPNPSFYSFTV